MERISEFAPEILRIAKRDLRKNIKSLEKDAEEIDLNLQISRAVLERLKK